MRPKFVIALVLGTILIVGLAVFAKRHLQQSSAVPEHDSEAVKESASAEAPLPPLPPPSAMSETTVKTVPASGLTAEQRQAMIDAEIMRINGVLGQNDSNSVALIFMDLTNSEKEVRVQAVAAVKQLGDRDLIPALTNLASATEDYEDRHALLEAADFLAMPTLAEVEKDLKPVATPISAPRPQSMGHGSIRRAAQRGDLQQSSPGNPAVPDPAAVPNN